MSVGPSESEYYAYLEYGRDPQFVGRPTQTVTHTALNGPPRPMGYPLPGENGFDLSAAGALPSSAAPVGVDVYSAHVAYVAVDLRAVGAAAVGVLQIVGEVPRRPAFGSPAIQFGIEFGNDAMVATVDPLGENEPVPPPELRSTLLDRVLAQRPAGFPAMVVVEDELVVLSQPPEGAGTMHGLTFLSEAETARVRVWGLAKRTSAWRVLPGLADVLLSDSTMLTIPVAALARLYVEVLEIEPVAGAQEGVPARVNWTVAPSVGA